MTDLSSAFLGGVEAKRRGLITQDALEESRRKRAEEDVLMGMKQNIAQSFKEMTTNEVEEQDPNTGLMTKRPKTAAERESARLRHESDLVAYAMRQNPVEGSKLQLAFEDRSAHKAMATMWGVTQSLLSGNAESGFKVLDTLYQTTGNERVDLEKSYYSKEKGEGVLVTVDKKDPTKFNSRPLTPGTIKGMFVGSANTPSSLLFLSEAAKAMESMSKAEVASQEAEGGIGTARVEKVKAETAHTEAQTDLTGIETELKQGLLKAGLPQATVDEITSRTALHKASAAHQNALASKSREGESSDNKSALAVLNSQKAYDTFLGIEKPGEMRKQYIQEKKIAIDNGASKEELQAIEDDFKERFAANARAMSIKGVGTSLQRTNKGLDIREALTVAGELEDAKSQAIKVIIPALEKDSGKKATKDDIEAAAGLLLKDKVTVKDGQRYYKLGNKQIKF